MSAFVRPIAIDRLRTGFAATFTVNSTSDTTDVKPGNGICLDSSDKCTVRAAVQGANALAGADTISIPAGTYGINRTGSGEDLADTGDLDVLSDITFAGAGMATTIIENTAGNDRIFDVIGAYTADFSDLTIKGGGYSGRKFGGGIYNQGGSIFLARVTLDSNTAANGGGIFSDFAGLVIARNVTFNANVACGAGASINDGTGVFQNVNFTSNILATCSGGGMSVGSTATVSVRNSLFRANESSNGAGITNYGTLTVSNSRFIGNIANNAGGGIYNSNQSGIFVLPGLLTVTASTFNGNTTAGDGAGLYNGGTATITTSTFSNNAAAGSGGGINNYDDTLAVINSTITGNSAAGAYGRGGGLFNYQGQTSLSNVTITRNTAPDGGGIATNTGSNNITIRNTVVSGNTGTSSEPDCNNGSNIISDGNNFIGDANACGYTAGASDQVGDSSSTGALDAKLKPLTNNGGATKTHAPATASSLVDAGNTAGCTDGTTALTTDQRGPAYSRTTDGNADGTAVCDIGAVEI